MNTLFKASLQKSLSYEDYRKLVKDLLDQNLSTGPHQSDDLTHYSKLNHQRMNRLDKTFSLKEETIQTLQKFSSKYIWLVISEGWCGDAAQCLPILHKMATATDTIDLQIVLRDENEELMNAYLTNGGKSIPKLIILDALSGKEVGNWGPRPAGATKHVNQLIAQYGGITDEVKEGLQKWYNENKGEDIQNEIIDIMKKPAL